MISRGGVGSGLWFRGDAEECGVVRFGEGGWEEGEEEDDMDRGEGGRDREGARDREPVTVLELLDAELSGMALRAGWVGCLPRAPVLGAVGPVPDGVDNSGISGLNNGAGSSVRYEGMEE